MKLTAVTCLGLGIMLVSSIAAAEEKGTVTLPMTKIVGNPQKPTAAIEVSKVRMRLPPTTPTLSAAGKIHDASKRDPF